VRHGESVMTLSLSPECGPTGEPLRLRFAEAWVADDLRTGTLEIDAYGAWDGDDGAVTRDQLHRFEQVDRGLIAYEDWCAERGMQPMRWRGEYRWGWDSGYVVAAPGNRESGPLAPLPVIPLSPLDVGSYAP
jgi:hypothetical protein